MSTKKATTTKKLTSKPINKRSAYITHVIPKKPIFIWRSHPEDDINAFGKLIKHLKEKENVQDINKSEYDNDFQNFYTFSIEPYKNIKEGYSFCTNPTTGVGEGYLVNTANDPENATLISADIDSSGFITAVYAILTFNVVNTIKPKIKVHTLCGNQVLPQSGEGTRLLKLIEKAGRETKLIKIALNPIDTAIPFYRKNKYRAVSENSPISENSSDYETDSDSPELTMQKNVRAQDRWTKLRTAVKLGTILKDIRESTKQHELQKKYKTASTQKAKERLMLKREATPIVPGATLLKGVKFVPKKQPGIPSKVIVPGESFALANKREEILKTAATTQKKEVEQIIANLKKSQKKTRKTNK